MSSPADLPPVPASSTVSPYRALPRGIWVLGFVSLCMDTSSELVHSILPIYMVSTLGASMTTIGLLEGTAEATAAFTKVFSGVISDAFRTRKPLIVLGYGLAALTKPAFPLAPSVEWVFGARFVDRIGKGIRGAPRDALMADITPPQQRGAAFGLRQSLDTIGAFLGPLLAIVLTVLFVDDIRSVLWVAAAPAVVAVLLLVLALHEPDTADRTASAANGIALGELKHLSSAYWLVVALGAIFSLARFSEAFLILRARDVGLTVAYIPAVLMVMNTVYALGAYPAGAASDRLPARMLLVLGLVALVFADVLLALATSPWLALLGAGCWGLHMALTQGLLSKLVADTAPTALRGTAFGIYNLVSGAALFLASLIAGVLWSALGVAATFGVGASIAAVAAVGMLLTLPQPRPRS